ncbi:Protein kinase [Actinomortierella ambigua]|uniref:non-specific serine/threonine protein kinase n=1 Tax=Actinomortierella ambigua TaxID=1343610 RepID=A0A9P6QIU8_9FUNG|nr:Protein kinase [Actinomortierella ambigua]
MTTNIKIGHYTLLETLGVGSFGKVKRAVHSLTGHTVAIKIINRNKVANQDMFARVKREIQYLKLLRHPHIIKLYEVISTPTSIYMVIEYAGGELFNHIVEKTRLSEDEARRFFQQIVCAVEYCHRHKIVHRDLKPENLLLDPSMNVKIGDFGLSNIMTDGDFLKTSCGSPNYAAPEVISGKLYAGPEVDVWSCGVILYVMLVGRLPFDDDYIPLLFKKINGGIYTLPSFLSPETKYLLTSMLVVDPLKRITIAEIRQNPWFNVNLPEYLKPLPQGTSDDLFCNLQEDIIQELVKKMNFSRETIIQALQERQNNQIKVAYQLVVDHMLMIENAAQMSPQKPLQSFLATSPPPWNASEGDNMGYRSGDASSAGRSLKSGTGDDSTDDAGDALVPSSITVLKLHRKASLKNTRREQQDDEQQRLQSPPTPSSMHSAQDPGTPAFYQAGVIGNNRGTGGGGGGIPSSVKATANGRSTTTGGAGGVTGSLTSTTATGAGGASNGGRRPKGRPKWYFGIRSRSEPLEVMAEIYKALKALGMKWKIINPYHLRAKYVYAEGAEVKIELQLYRLDVDNYLVDFKYVGLHSIHADEARAQLLRELNEQQMQQQAQQQVQQQQQQQLEPSPLPQSLSSEQQQQQQQQQQQDLDRAMNDNVSNHTYPRVDVELAGPGTGPQDIPYASESGGGTGLAPGETGRKTLVSFQGTSPRVDIRVEEHPPSLTSVGPRMMGGTPTEGRSIGSGGSSNSLMAPPPPAVPATLATTADGMEMLLSSSSSPAASLGKLSSSLLQEQQQMKNLEELHQERQHQQRQRDQNRRPTHLLFPRSSYQLVASVKEVTSPYPFFDVCAKLITELAIGTS